MAPKASKNKEPEVTLDEEAQKALDESNRLQNLSYDSGIIAKARRMDADKSSLELPARLDGKDIVKKGNMRKNRYLLNIPAQLSAMTAGKMGSLAQLDTRNPVLYIDFEEGRLKFKGTLFFPKNKYMTLRLAQKEVRCEDIFESLIVFSEHCWIGTKAENPEEHPMPMPSTLPIAPEEAKPVAGSQQVNTLTQPTQLTQTQEPNGDAEPAVRSSQRKRKQASYNEKSSESEGEQGSDSDSGTQKQTKRPKPACRRSTGRAGLSEASKDIVQLDSSDSGDDAPGGLTDEDLTQIPGPSQRSQPLRSARPKKSMATIVEVSSGEEEPDEEESDSSFGD